MRRAVKEHVGPRFWTVLAGLLLVAGCSPRAAEDAGRVAETPQAGAAEARPDPGPPAPKPVPYVTPGTITQVDLQRVLELQDAGKVLLVDVRGSLFYAMGHLPEAISLPKKKFEAEFPKVKSSLDGAVAAKRVLVLYCANVDCPDAYTVGKLLSHKGYSVSLYKGGWDEWKMTGF